MNCVDEDDNDDDCCALGRVKEGEVNQEDIT